MLLIWSMVLVSICLIETTCLMEQKDLPPELLSCYQRFVMKSNITETVDESKYYFCMQQFLWKTERIQWAGFNITQEDKDFINSLLRRILDNRQQTRVVPSPPTGFRMRQEYRRLTDKQRMAFHMAIRQMKQAGEYDTFANLHQGIVAQSAYGGPNFFGWHRIYLALFEEALRRYNRSVAIPYWDSTMDFDMVDPTQSIIWTSPFLGNGNGLVNTGPFAHFQTPSGPLTRNVGDRGTLLSKAVINNILTRCRTADISEPTAMNQFNLELASSGVHNWVGGQMSRLNTAAHDPVFFLHKAFVDYIWELFRTRQKDLCGVNPAVDYPPATGRHAPQRVMDGLQKFRNIDGYANNWATLWYNYEKAPECDLPSQNCGSPYLICDMARNVCVPLTRPAVGEAQEAALNVGLQFRAQSSDRRTLGAAVKAKVMNCRSQAMTGSGLGLPIQNTFFLNGVSDVNKWVFVPIQVEYQRSPGDIFKSFPVQNGQPVTNSDMYGPSSYPSLMSYLDQGNTASYEHCQTNPSGAGQVIVQSHGLNYMGTYSDYAILDSRLPVSSAIAYVGIKSPADGMAEVMFSAFDRCGRMCQATCMVQGTDPPVYKPCSGAMRVTPGTPKMFGSNFGEAVMNILKLKGNDKTDTSGIQVVFHCTSENVWPWADVKPANKEYDD